MDKTKQIATKPTNTDKRCTKDKELPEPYDDAMLWRHINFCIDDALKTKKTFTRL